MIALASASWNNASGATINAADTSFVAVQTAINFASDGDTVILPAGSSTWTTTLTCTKGINIIGAGIGSTIITSGLPGNAAALVIQVGTKSFTLSGFTFQDTSTSAFGFGIVQINGTTGWRIHDCKFDNIHGAGLAVWTHIGLVDHCTFNLITGTSDGIVLIVGTVGNATTTAIWNTANVFGDVNYVYIEDCTFTSPDGVPADGAIDAYNGAKYVFRHNTVINTYVGHHGYDSGGYRSTYACEVYNNTFSTTKHIATFMHSRGGTGVYFNNTCTDSSGLPGGIELDAYRESPESFPSGFFNSNSGPADGTKAVDGNLSGQTESGTPYVGFAYPLLDQIGRTGPTTFGPSSSTQTLSPVYAWNNTLNGNPMYASGWCGSQVVVANRDYYNSAKPGYTSYTYPHPLVAAASGPSPPTNLHIE